ncbi:MAG TPA: alpha/beta fold hydrolase [Candidatus Binataceae bacterium]|nr:alpha/beta fold hydrolase [Candidatus Binataceae bacterium]
MDSADDDPHPPKADTNEFFLPGAGLSALLIHGLTGTPYEMRYLGEQLASAGIRVLGVKLAGHAGAPEELAAVTHAHWYESAVDGFERLRAYGDPNIVIGLSMGALLATRLAIDQPEAVAGVVMLAPAFFLGWRSRFVLRALRPAAKLADQLFFHKPGGSDIHDAAARGIHPGSRLIPLRAALNLLELSDYVRPKMSAVEQPALLIHGRNDHVCPFAANVDFVMGNLGSQQKRLVALEESFHVITVDSEKERVAREVADFITPSRAPEAARATARGGR